MFRTLMLLTALIIAPALAAQTQTFTDPSAEEESFHVEPAAVPAGAREFAIRLIANQKDLFAYNGKQPELTFGEGITLVDGSLNFISSSEIQAQINVEEERIAPVALFVDFFALDNENTIIKRARGHVGVTGPVSIGAQQSNVPFEISAGSVNHIVINAEEAQETGDILLTGRLSGTFSIETPNAMRFAMEEDPEAVLEDGDGSIVGPNLTATRQLFSFQVANVRGAEITIRITNMWLDTSTYGGDPTPSREYAMLVDGGPLTTGILVVNAYSAGGTQEGSEIDQSESTPPASETDTSSGLSNSGGGGFTGGTSSNGSASSSNRSNSSGGRDNRSRTNRSNWRGNRGNWSGRSYQGGVYNRNASSRNNRSGGGNGGNFSNSARGGAGGAAALPNRAGGGSQSSLSGRGKIESGRTVAGGEGAAEGEGESSSTNSDSGAASGQIQPASGIPLQRAKNLYFADKDYQAVNGLVLQRLVRGELRGRIWIVLEHQSETDEVDRVTVTLKIEGRERQVELVETGAKTGVFHSAADGIELASDAPKNE